MGDEASTMVSGVDELNASPAQEPHQTLRSGFEPGMRLGTLRGTCTVGWISSRGTVQASFDDGGEWYYSVPDLREELAAVEARRESTLRQYMTWRREAECRAAREQAERDAEVASVAARMRRTRSGREYEISSGNRWTASEEAALEEIVEEALAKGLALRGAWEYAAEELAGDRSPEACRERYELLHPEKYTAHLHRWGGAAA